MAQSQARQGLQFSQQDKKILINKRQPELIEKIVNYVIDPNVYTHKRAKIVYDPEKRTAKKEVVAKVFFEENYKRQLNLLRTKLNTLNLSIYESIVGTEQETFNQTLDQDDLINNLRKEFFISLIKANQTVGLDAAHAISSMATQKTLNSFHFAGHLKDTEGSISSLTGTLNVSDNVPRPNSTILFKRDPQFRPRNFYDILDRKRRKYVGVKANMFIKSKEITNPTELFGTSIDKKNIEYVNIPYYYSLYEALFGRNLSDEIKEARGGMLTGESSKDSETFNDIKDDLWDHPVACKQVTMLRYTLDLDMMYSFRITPKQIAEAIDDNSSGIYFSVFSPIVYEKRQVRTDSTTSPYSDTTVPMLMTIREPTAYIDVYLNVDQMRIYLSTENLVSLKTLEIPFLHAQAMNTIGGVWASGIPNIETVYPDKIELTSMISGVDFLMKSEQGRGSYYNMYFNHREMRLYNVEVSQIIALLEISDFVQLQNLEDVDELKDDKVFILEDKDDLSNMTVIVYSRKNPRELLVERAEQEDRDSKDFTQEQTKLRNELYNEGDINRSYKVKIFREPTPFEENNDIFFMKTKGTNLLAVWKRDDVDVNRTYCNDAILIRSLLGHEAARSLSLMELNKSMSFGYIDPRHTMVAVDYMYREARIKGFKSKGYEQENVSALAQTIPAKGRETEVTSRRAGLGEVTEIASSNDSVMVSGEANLGTTSRNTDVLFDFDFKDRVKQRQQEFKKEYPDRIFNDLYDYSDAVVTPNTLVERVGNTLESMSGGLVDTSAVLERDPDQLPESQAAKLARVARVVAPYLARAMEKLPSRQEYDKQEEGLDYNFELRDPVWSSNLSSDKHLLGQEELDPDDVYSWDYQQEEISVPELGEIESEELNLDLVEGVLIQFRSRGI